MSLLMTLSIYMLCLGVAFGIGFSFALWACKKFVLKARPFEFATAEIQRPGNPFTHD